MSPGSSGRFYKGVLGAAVFGVVFLVIVGLGGWLFYRESKRALVSQTAVRLSAIADLKTEQLTVLREDLLREVIFLPRSPYNDSDVASFLAGRGAPQSERSLRRWLEDLRRSTDALGVALLDRRPAVRLGVGESAGKVGAPGVASVRAALSGRRAFLSDIHRGANFTDVHMDLAVPLEAASGAGIGALLFHLSVERFIYPVVQQWPGASDSGECVLVRTEGDDYLVLNDLRFQEGAVLKARGALSDDSRPAARAARGIEGFMRGRDYRGERVFAETRNVRDTGWHLVVKIDEDEVFHPLHVSVAIIFGGLLLLTLATVFGMLYWSRRRDMEALSKELAAERERLDVAERYAALTRQANDAVFMVDEWMNIVEANDRAEALFAYTRSELLAMKLDQLDAGEGGIFSREVDAGRGLVFATAYRRRDGSLLPVEVSVSRVEVKGKHLYLALVRDASERRKAELASRHNEARLQSLLEFAQMSSTLDEAALLARVLEKSVALTNSRVGYVCGVDEDQKGIMMMACSKELMQERSKRYSLDQAGPWADCLRLGRAVIHNESTAIPGKTDLPQAPSPLSRLMCVPVFDGEGRAQFILGVGNKDAPYEDADLRLLQIAAEAFWKTLAGHRASQGIAVSQQRYDSLIAEMPVPMVIFEKETAKVRSLNPAASRLLGRRFPDLEGHPVEELHPEEERAQVRANFARHAAGLTHHTFARPILGAGGTIRLVDVISFPYESEGTSLLIVFYLDVTELRRSEEERKRVEAQLHQVQRLETVGRLAGGVAHDFNNILTALLGHCSLLKETFAPGDARLADLDEIEASGLRAAGLTRQLLAFSRRQRVSPLPTDLNAVVLGLQPMLRRLIGEDIHIALALCAEPWPVLVDPGQMEQVLLNLAVNARDAMPRGGVIAISTANEVLSDPVFTRHGVIGPGRFLRLTVKDDGDGMSPQTLEHLFEPFFTTKSQGKGTGLGLATVYGIVQQLEGAISVESAPGAGSAFSVRFPAVDAAVERKSISTPMPPAHAAATILLVEDEEAVRRLIERILTKDGYKVSAFAGGAEARDRFFEAPLSFDLLLSDLVMPGMDGVALAQALRASRPGLPVIFMSGYNDPERIGAVGAGERFLQKPLAPESLLAEVASALAGPPS